jgi:hypothetical protein
VPTHRPQITIGNADLLGGHSLGEIKSKRINLSTSPLLLQRNKTLQRYRSDVHAVA